MRANPLSTQAPASPGSPGHATEGSCRHPGAPPAPTLAVKSALLQARRQQRLASQPATADAAAASHVLSTADGALTFALRSSGGRLLIERTQRRPLNTHMIHAMVFERRDAFIRWCDEEPLRFEDPHLHQRLRRHGEEFDFTAVEPAASNEAIGLLDVIEQMTFAADMGEATRLLAQAAALLGAGAAMFTSCIVEETTLSSYRFLVACDPIWGSQYGQNGWCLDDPWLSYAKHHTEPIRAQDLTGLSARERWVIDGAAHFGFRSALIIPVPTPAAQSRCGVLCLGSAQAEGFADGSWLRLAIQARSVATQLGDWMHRMVKSELMKSARITQDDLVLLRHQQLGHNSKAIAQALNTEAKTIDSRFHRLRMKLCAPNRRSALRMAEIYGLL